VPTFSKDQITILTAIAKQKSALNSLKAEIWLNRTDIEVLCASYLLCAKNNFYFEVLEVLEVTGKGSEAGYASINKMIDLELVERLTVICSPIEPHRFAVTRMGQRILLQYANGVQSPS
jgi:hypothetical protein